MSIIPVDLQEDIWILTLYRIGRKLQSQVYIEKKLSDPTEGDLNKLRLLTSCIEQWLSGKAGEYEYRDEHPEYRMDYITDDELDRIMING